MELIEDIGMKRASDGQMVKWGLFYCKYCDKEVERRRGNGRHICNQKYITINETGKCFFYDIIDELKNKKIDHDENKNRQ